MNIPMRNGASATVMRALAAVLSLACSAASPGVRADDTPDQVEQIKRAILVGPAMDTLRELVHRHGARVTGTGAYEQAAHWAADRFRAAGIENVRFETFTLPNGWERGAATAKIEAPLSVRLHLESVGWSPATPPEGVRGEVVWIDDLSAENIARVTTHLRNRVVVLDTAKLFADGSYAAYLSAREAYPLFKRAGAVAVLFPNDVPGNLLGKYVDLSTGGQVQPLPMAEIGMEDARLIRDLSATAPVRLHFTLTNHVTGPVQAPNVIAEIRGQVPDEWILVGGHLDSWDYATGASDNGAGSVAVLEAARVLAQTTAPLRRSIRFVLWGGEEAGQLGSQDYARRHTDELARHVAIINTDSGAGRPLGWRVADRPDLRSAFQPLADAYLADLGADQVALSTTCSSDHCAFLVRGIPTFNTLVDRSEYERLHHRNSDTLDKVDVLDFKAGVALVATTAYLLAQQPQPIGRHLTRAEVAAALRKAGLAEALVKLGRWQP
jgi:carboxypeptidase Q